MILWCSCTDDYAKKVTTVLYNKESKKVNTMTSIFKVNCLTSILAY